MEKKNMNLIADLALESAKMNATDPMLGNRAHAILLHYNQGYSPKQLADIFFVTEATIQFWIKRYKTLSIEGLVSEPILDAVESLFRVRSDQIDQTSDIGGKNGQSPMTN